MHYDGLGWEENGVIDLVYFFIQSLRYFIVGGGEKDMQVLFFGSCCGGCNYLGLLGVSMELELNMTINHFLFSNQCYLHLAQALSFSVN
jgi:hypothetical protein